VVERFNKEKWEQIKARVEVGLGIAAIGARGAVRLLSAFYKRAVEYLVRAIENLRNLPPPAAVLRSHPDPRRLMVIAVAVPVFLTAGLLYQQSHPGERIARRALAAVEEPGKITYYSVSGRLGGVPPTRASTWQAEYWIDYGRGLTKTIRRFTGVDEKLVATALVKGGKPLTTEEADRLPRAYESELAGNAPLPFGDQPRDGVTLYREMLKRGSVELLGRETVGGLPTFQLKTVLGRAGGTDVGIINVRTDNHHPVRILHEVRENGPDPDGVRLRSDIITFRKVRLLDPEELGEQFFAPRTATGQNLARAYSPAAIRGFKEFDLYYLGRSFAGRELGSFVYARQVQRNRLPGVPGDRVMIDYQKAEPAGDGVFLTIRPAVRRSVIASALAPVGKKSLVEINGKKAVLNEAGNAQSPFYRLFVNAGNATVEIIAESRDTVLSAARNLVKIR